MSQKKQLWGWKIGGTAAGREGLNIPFPSFSEVNLTPSFFPWKKGVPGLDSCAHCFALCVVCLKRKQFKWIN